MASIDQGANLITENVTEALDRMYFALLRKAVLKVIERNLIFLPTLKEVGSFNIKVFEDFLRRYQIQYSGPYRWKGDDNRLDVQFFISSDNVMDSLFNGGISFHGVYRFSLSAIHLRHDYALNWFNLLPQMPFWITQISPSTQSQRAYGKNINFHTYV